MATVVEIIKDHLKIKGEGHTRIRKMSFSQQRKWFKTTGMTLKSIRTIRRYALVLVVSVFVLAYVQLSYMESWSQHMRNKKNVETFDQISSTVTPDNQNFLKNRNKQYVNKLNPNVESAKDSGMNESKLYGKTLTLTYREGVDTNYTATPLMFLFSSWKYTKEKALVHAATIRLWSAWPSIRTAVFTQDTNVTEYATAAGWEVLSKLTVHEDCFGPPVLAPMFSVMKNNYRAHYYGFSNSDIMFGDGLELTLKFLHEYQHDAWKDKPLLIIGRRYNVDFENDTSISLNTPSDVKDVTAKGSLVLRSTDYFFTNTLFPWQNVPKVTIGRPFVVRSIIGYALKNRIAVIDATKTIEAVHLTTGDGNRASWNPNLKGLKCNQKVLSRLHGSIPVGKGHCECSLLETFMENNTMHVRRRKPNKTLCK